MDASSQFDNFISNIRSCFIKYANFSGRASRGEFWQFQLFFWAAYIGLQVIGLMVFGTPRGRGGLLSGAAAFGLLSSLFALVALVPGLAVGWRRMHDQNKSGWRYFGASFCLHASLIGIVTQPFFWLLAYIYIEFSSVRRYVQLQGVLLGVSVVISIIIFVVVLIWYVNTLKGHGDEGENQYGPSPSSQK